MNYLQNKKNNYRMFPFKGIGIAALVVALFAVAIPLMGSYTEESTVTTVVNSHERVCDSGADNDIVCRYLVFTDAGTFALTDSILIGRWDSSDLYGRIKDGETYIIASMGWRFGCTNTYPNIKSMELA